MTKVPITDLHCDTATEILDGRSLYENDGMVSIAKMREAGVFCQFFAMFIRMSEYESIDAAFRQLLKNGEDIRNPDRR